MKKIKIIRIIILILAIIIFSFTTYKIVIFIKDIKVNEKKNNELIEEVKKEEVITEDEEVEEKITIDFDKLFKINKDIIGWIKHNKIDYPILQSTNNEYYLTHTYDKKVNQTGSISMDYKNSYFNDNNVVLYGHSMLDGSMFGSLRDMLKSDYFNKEENNYIKIITMENVELTYQIFSYYIIDAEDYYITTSFKDNDEFKKFVNTIKNRSKKKFNVKVDENSKILTLSTCYGTGETNQRKVVHAVLVE